MLRRLPFRAGLSALTVLAACQSHPDKKAAMATEPAAVSKPAAAPAQPSDSAGAWYRTYRAALGPNDSITLHLQSWPQILGDHTRGHLFGTYSHAAGEPLVVEGNTVADPDSVVLLDQSITLLNEGGESPVWRLKRQGQELVGTWNSQPVRLREAVPAGGLTFVSRYLLDSLAAFPKSPQPGAPYARWSLLALEPGSGPAAPRRLVAATILRALHGDSLDTRPVPTLAALFQEQGQLFTKDYRRTANDALQQLPASERKSFPPFLNYEEQRITEILWNQGGLLSIGSQFYAYTGGAHGNYGTQVLSLDTRTGRTLRYADIFRPDAKAPLQNLLGRYVRRTLGQEPTTPMDEFLFVKQMPVTHNVYLTSGGAVFVYAPYEIASYAQGEVQVFVPFRDLQPLLRTGLPVGSPAS